MTDNGTDRTSAPRPRIIERWFPCAEVSAASGSGWGGSRSETAVMAWFAKRPLAQSRAAVLCSLLPWPEDSEDQERVQAVIREALGSCQDPDWYACRQPDCDDLDCTRKTHMSQRPASNPHAYGIVDCVRQDPNDGYDAARTDVIRLLKDAYPDGPAEMLDPFSGRGLIPIEAARYGQQTYAMDYSPVATLASRLLIDWPFRDWSEEPELPFDPPGGQIDALDSKDPQRLIRDIETVQAEVQRRVERELDEFYPDDPKGEKPWGYLWASVIPCDGCGREFPLFGSNVLRDDLKDRPGTGRSFELHTGPTTWNVAVVDGVTDQLPTMRSRPGRRGKLAWCPYQDCGHAHELPEHKRLVKENYHRITMLVVADLAGSKKTFRAPTDTELKAAERAAEALVGMTVNGLSARPDERPLKGTDRIGAVIYGAENMGDLSVDRQNLLHAHIAQAISDIATEMRQSGVSGGYASALAGYCAAVLARKQKYSTRGVWLRAHKGKKTSATVQVSDVFVNESSLAFNYDFFEVGLGSGPGSWETVGGVPGGLRVLVNTDGRSAVVQRGSALAIPHRDGELDAVVTDPLFRV